MESLSVYTKKKGDLVIFWRNLLMSCYFSYKIRFLIYNFIDKRNDRYQFNAIENLIFGNLRRSNTTKTLTKKMLFDNVYLGDANNSLEYSTL